MKQHIAGRSLQLKELQYALLLANPECTLNLTLQHHLIQMGWRFDLDIE